MDLQETLTRSLSALGTVALAVATVISGGTASAAVQLCRVSVITA